MISALIFAAVLQAQGAPPNRYPTEVSADYILGCMAANGQTQDSLRRCACSIDAVASILPYEIYERAETALRMRGVAGEAAGLFRDAPTLKTAIDRLRAAQVEADFRCF
jgi:hypothetical protein